MKAKEWYLKLRDCGSQKDFEDTLVACLRSLIEDADKLIKIRKAKSDDSVSACIKEVNNKWESICRMHESANYSGCDSYIATGVALSRDGFKGAYVRVHPNKGWLFDIKQHKAKMDRAEIDIHIDETYTNATLILYGLKKYEELTQEDLTREWLQALYCLGTTAKSDHPNEFTAIQIVLAKHIGLLRKWIDSGSIDLNDVKKEFSSAMPRVI